MRMRPEKLLYGLTGMVVLGVSPLHAAAQEPSDNDVISIFEREREDYKADGVPAGAFIIEPKVAVSGYHDDNVFADDTNEQSDFIWVASPRVSARSDWNRHALRVSAGAKIGRYQDFSNEDYEDYSLGADGKLDLWTNSSLKGSLNYQRKHEDRDSPDDANGLTPTEFDQTNAKVWFTRAEGKAKLTLTGGVEKLAFDDVRTSVGTTIDNSDRDRVIYDTAARVSYAFIPNYDAFIEAGYDWREYDLTMPVNRDSTGWRVVGGTEINLTGKLKGEVYAGFRQRTYDDSSRSDIDGFTFGGNMLWNITGLTSMRGSVEQSVQETDQNANGYVNTAFNVNLEHELMRNILLGANIGYILQEYDGSGTAGNREDDITKAGLSLDYLFRRGITLGLKYDYADRDSNIVNNDYSISRAMFTVGAAL